MKHILILIVVAIAAFGVSSCKSQPNNQNATASTESDLEIRKVTLSFRDSENFGEALYAVVGREWMLHGMVDEKNNKLIMMVLSDNNGKPLIDRTIIYQDTLKFLYSKDDQQAWIDYVSINKKILTNNAVINDPNLKKSIQNFLKIAVFAPISDTLYLD